MIHRSPPAILKTHREPGTGKNAFRILRRALRTGHKMDSWMICDLNYIGRSLDSTDFAKPFQRD